MQKIHGQREKNFKNQLRNKQKSDRAVAFCKKENRFFFITIPFLILPAFWETKMPAEYQKP